MNTNPTLLILITLAYGTFMYFTPWMLHISKPKQEPTLKLRSSISRDGRKTEYL